jgi:hypothetical protein
VPNVKGSALASRLLWVRLNHGEAGLARVTADGSAALRAVAEAGAVHARWYPLEVFVELNTALDRLFGAGDTALIRELGRYSADANLTTIYRLFYKVGTVRWILSRGPRLWGVHYDAGSLVIRYLGAHEVELEIVDFPTPHRAHCLAVMGWAERSIELSGGEQVTTHEVGCRANGDLRCRFRLRWQ